MPVIKKQPNFSIAILNKDFSIKSVSNSFLNLLRLEEVKPYFQNILETSLENIDIQNISHSDIVRRSNAPHPDNLQNTLSRHISFFDILPKYNDTLLSQAIKLALKGKINH
ncbi:hypothetical protein WAF17_14895 [Bernardetia sp. ABR2-2B]|uniref:hypothetical protein n=1 Tax=Bernardetia sp. ABR2-2B TaxID=3127472 RepID=UPI0030D2A0D6